MTNEINIDLGKRRSLKANIGVPGYLGKGDTGTGIESITYKGEDEYGGNMYTVLLTDGTSYDITAPKGAKGDKGDAGGKGDTGVPGKAATIQVGEVTTGAAGTPASVSNVGTDEAAIFDFTIPRGDKGADGAAGADGVTPHIGDNGNWYLGTTDTGKPSRGETGLQGPAGPVGPQGPQGEKGEDAAADLTLGLTGATVGQIAKIAAVDESGVPTAWEPVDMPSGGGKEWRKVIDAEVTEPTAEFIRDGLNGATELHIAWSNLQNASTKESGLSVKINNILVSANQTAAIVQKNGSTIYGWTHLKFDGLHWMLCKSAGAIYADNISQSIAYTIYNLVENVGAANTIKFAAPTMQYAPVSGKLEVWAR